MDKKNSSDDGYGFGQFAYAFGKTYGALSMFPVRKELKKRGITDQDIKDFKKAAEKIARAFYSDNVGGKA